ncbi:hypothetical protein [Hoeflea sp.]|uniref:VHL beta domain-containing protein n=1 Tax=Hoeflea sp. TaxID=1940281 RepID=UPI003A8CEF9B
MTRIVQSLTQLLSACLGGLMAVSAAAAQGTDAMVWQSYQYDDADNGGATSSISVGVPETDHVIVLGTCSAAGQSVPRVTFGAPVDGLGDGDRMHLRFLDVPGAPVYSGQAAGTAAEFGVSGIEMELPAGDMIWTLLSERSTIRYAIGGETITLPLRGSARAIDRFLNDCASYAGNTAAGSNGTAPKQPTAANPMTCEAYAGARSQNSIVPATVTFDNRTDGYRSILWLDFEGNPQQMAALNPGESSTINTYLTHPWMITDGPGNCLEIHMPQPGTNSFAITAPNRWFGDE